MVNKKIKPKVNSNGVFIFNHPPHIVANQLNILIPVGIAITMVAAVKYARVSTSKPTTYIWCAQTKNPNIPIDIIAQTIPMYPNILLLVNVSII
jgi:hypothetical protein